MANAVRLIRRLSRKYGLDPRAVIAVARGEGGLRNRPGDIGDQGTSFGPFQLHRGGALPQGIANPDAWAWSRAGIDYALRKMSESGASGLTGNSAIETIIRKFERPADPESSIANAVARYGQATQPGGLDPTPGNEPGTSSAIETFTNKPQVMALRDEARQGLLNELLTRSRLRSSGQEEEIIPNRLHSAFRAIQEAENTPVETWERATTQSGTRTVPGLSQVVGGFAGKGGSIIGTPFSGTHTIGNWESDNAIDVALPEGTPIYAAFDGVIGDRFGPLSSTDPRFAGLRLHLIGNKNHLYYAHLSKFAPGIKPGMRVRRGQVIGYSGSANGVAHLHLGSERGDPRNFWRQNRK